MSQHPKGIFEKVKGSGIWYVRYADASGLERREKAGTKGMALMLYRKRKTEAVQGKKLPETLRRKAVTVAELLDLAAEHARRHYISARPATDAADSRHPALAKEFGALDAATLTPQRIEQGLARIAAARHFAPATVNCYRDYLSLAFKFGVRNGLVSANPARLLARQREDNSRVRFLSPEEEGRLREAIRVDCSEHEPELDLALNTGLRQGNQYGLRWVDVDLDARQITIGRAKNGRPFYAPINSAALEALLRLKRMAGGSPYVILNRNDRGRGVGEPARDPDSWFTRVVARAGLNGVCWHTLRHTFASRAIMAGLDIREVADLLGHRTLAMAMRYSHLAPQHRLRAAERVAEAFPQIRTGTKTGTGEFGAGAAAPAEAGQPLAVQ